MMNSKIHALCFYRGTVYGIEWKMSLFPTNLFNMTIV